MDEKVALMGEPHISTLPLFPLAQVLFPYVPLQLKVFEQRYLDMVSNVLKADGAFGIVPIISGSEVGLAPEIFPFGTLVTIRDWQRLTGGLLGITVMGEQRFCVGASAADQQQLLTAEVTLLTENRQRQSVANDPELLAMLNALSDHPLVSHLTATQDIGLSELSWLFAELAPLPRELRLRLLSMADGKDRLAVISDFLEQLINVAKLENQP